MKIKFSLFFSSMILFMLLISDGFGAWQDCLSFEVHLKANSVEAAKSTKDLVTPPIDENCIKVPSFQNFTTEAGIAINNSELNIILSNSPTMTTNSSIEIEDPTDLQASNQDYDYDYDYDYNHDIEVKHLKNQLFSK